PCHPITGAPKSPRILFDDPKKETRSFTVKLSALAGTKRGQGRGTFVGSVLALVDSFYESVVQHIKPCTPPAPTIKTRQNDDEAIQGDDGISGELPLKSRQRDVSPPECPLCQHGVTHQPVHELLMKGGEKSPCNDSIANDSQTEHRCWCHERTLQW